MSSQRWSKQGSLGRGELPRVLSHYLEVVFLRKGYQMEDLERDEVLKKSRDLMQYLDDLSEKEQSLCYEPLPIGNLPVKGRTEE